MIRPPSLQKTWSAFATADSAIIKPPIAPKQGDDESAEDFGERVKAFKADIEEWANKIRVARETGDWTAVVIAGETPTKFQMGQVDRNVWRSIMDRVTLPADSPRHIGQVQLGALLFRLSVQEIVGFDKFHRLSDPQWDHWTMAPAALVTQLDEIDQSIVGEIGGEVFRRLRGVGPLG